MRNMVKKIAALLICLCMIFNVYAGEAKASNSDMDDYALSVAADMLRINGYDGLDGINISNRMPVYNLEEIQEDKYVYILVDNSEPIAMLVVERIDGQYYASLEIGVSEVITNVYEDNISFALCCYKGCLIVHTNEEDIVVKNEFGIEISENSLDYSNVDLQRITIAYQDIMSVCENVYSIGNTAELQSTYGAYTVSTLAVPYVANGNSPADGEGICWAASMASILNYRVETNYTALSLYNNLWSKYTGYGSGDFPEGNATWIKRAFSYGGLSYTYIDGGLKGSQISAALSNKCPIYMSLVSNEGNHAVVIKGIYVYGNNNNYYQLMDPNQSGTVTVTVRDNVLNDPYYFACTLLSITYYNWRYSYY